MSEIEASILQQLQQQAAASGCSVGDLLRTWLESATPVTHTSDHPQLHPAPMAQLIEHLPLAVAIFDTEIRYLRANRMWREQYRLGDVKLIGKSHYEIFPEIGDDWKAIHQRCLAGEINTNACAPFPRHDGRLDWIRWEVRPWYLDHGQTIVGGLMMYTEVITERIETEQKLRQSELRHRSLFEQSNDAIVLITIEGNYLDANQQALDMLGYTLEELKAINQIETVAHIERDKSNDVLQRLLAGETLPPYERMLRRKDGSTFPAELNVGLIYDDDGHILYVQSIARDITERKKQEAALRERDLLFKIAFHSSPDAINLNRVSDGLYIDVNDGFCDILGYERDEVIGKTSLDLNIWANSEDRAQLVEGLSSRGVVKALEADFQHKDGSIVSGLMSARVLTYAGEEVILSVTRDITEYKYNQQIKQDYNRLTARFQKEQEQNQLIQRIISMLSHDLRTPLAVIASSRGILDRYFDHLTEDKRREKLDTIGRQVQFAIELLEDTVNMARGDLSERNFRPEAVNLATLCQVSLNEIRVASNITQYMVFENPSDVGVVQIDEVLVSRILLNLLSNAIKYSPDESAICLTLDREPDWIILKVSDHGIGIRSDDLAHIFEPFYRADDVGSIQGTGLGLSIVRDCVDRHQGQISVESEPGKGSIFTVRLPV